MWEFPFLTATHIGVAPKEFLHSIEVTLSDGPCLKFFKNSVEETVCAFLGQDVQTVTLPATELDRNQTFIDQRLVE